jgi:MYXO-CTERM domain-containing protein
MALVAGLAGSASAQLVQTINYSNFNDVTHMLRNGVAAQSSGLVGEQSTLSITPPVAAAAGTSYYDAKQKVDLGFVTDFKFRIRDRSGSGSDGLAFIVQNTSASAVGGGGGGIGFGTNLAFPTNNMGIANSLAIVFDVWDNNANWPTIPGANVITIQTSHLGPSSANTPSSIDSIGSVPVSGAFNDGAIHQVRIAYSSGTMQVYFDNLATPAVTALVNLSNSLNLTGGTDAWVGFTAATGAPQNAERHEILDWQFSSMQVPSPAGVAVLGLGSLVALRRRRAR